MERNLQHGDGTAGGPDMVKGSDGQIRYAAKGAIGRKGGPECSTASASSMSALEPSSLTGQPYQPPRLEGSKSLPHGR
jgi:hypothetical protein